MRAWRWLADTTAYLTLFITITSVYLWFVLRAERRIGYILLGVVDARNTRLETADEVARYTERALKLVPQERLVLAPTTSLEYLPRDVARAKLSALVEGARLVAGEKVPA